MAEIYRMDEKKKKKKASKPAVTDSVSYVQRFQKWIKKKIDDHNRENQRKYQIPGADKHLGIKRDKEGYIIKPKQSKEKK